ncbi:MAG: DUF87 domain-containing protein [Acidobacteriota bacterium]
MTSPVDRIAALCVGTVESVSPDEIHVILDVDAPQSVALNAGTPTGFPRINGYVLIPSGAGAVVGLIVFLGVERSAFPKRTGLKDFGLIDLPFPLRKLHVTPVGTLRFQDSNRGLHHVLSRGVAVFPSVGDPVLIPTIEQLTSIVESEGDDGRLRIGTSPLAANARVFVDPDKLFGRHLAVLGNTGSGKSCSVAGLIRWSIDAARDERKKAGRGSQVNARFIVLDPNGEYLKTFDDLPNKPRVFQVPPAGDGTSPLGVPAWMWNSSEWAAFAQAAPGVQRPLLLEALRAMRGGTEAVPTPERQIGTVVRGRLVQFRALIARGAPGYTGFRGGREAGENIQQSASDLEQFAGTATEHVDVALRLTVDGLRTVAAQRQYTTAAGRTGFNDFGETHLRTVEQLLKDVEETLPQEAFASAFSEDAPIKFDVAALPDLLDTIARREGGGQAQFVANLTMRIRMLLADRRLRAIVIPDEELTVVEWLDSFVGRSNADNGQLTVIDLSLVPSEIIHIVIAVLARFTFEAVQRYRKLRREELPTVLVLEEAHAFVHRERQDIENIASPAQMCRATFEKIAREGRKFGLGLLLSSQRPSELSATVLAQCNTFLLHRLVNDRDQELVARLVPDNVRGLLRELPSLPAGQAILLGWAAAVPTLVDMRRLPKEHQPQSSDPEFWNVWTGEKDRPISWKDIHDDWIA